MSNESKAARMVYETRDYSLFKLMPGNREVQELRKRRVRDSLKKVGQIAIPIVVNERFEIIDGQARFEVFKEDGLPIYYIQIDGLAIPECMALNTASTGWNLQDYIDSGVTAGHKSYIMLKELHEKHKAVSIQALIAIIAQVYGGSANRRSASNPVSSAAIKAGTFTMSEQEKDSVDDVLTYIDEMMAFGRGNGNTTTFQMSVAFSYRTLDIEGRKRLVSKWSQLSTSKSANARYGNIPECLSILSGVYNNRARGADTVYLDVEYDKYCRETSAAYAKRWGEESGRRKTHKSA